MVTSKKETKTPKKPKAAKPAASAKAEASAQPARNPLHTRRQFVGFVVSDKMQKTIVVRVDRRVRHAEYGKYILRSEKFKAHDEKNEAKIGDMVSIVETRPLSKDKRWALRGVLRRAGQAALIDVPAEA